MNTFGQHLLVEYQGCDAAALNDQQRIETLMRLAASEAQAHIVSSLFHPFSPHGVSGVVVVEESHLSIHTWPEHAYAAVDFYSCGACFPERAQEVLRAGLDARSTEVMRIHRGLGRPSTMAVQAHHREDIAADAAEAGIRGELGLAGSS